MLCSRCELSNDCFKLLFLENAFPADLSIIRECHCLGFRLNFSSLDCELKGDFSKDIAGLKFRLLFRKLRFMSNLETLLYGP